MSKSFKNISRQLICALTLSVVLAACGEQDASQTSAAQFAPPAPKVTAAKPIIRNVTDSETFTGRFEAVESVDVRARVNGYLQSIDFTDGALVEKGDKLFVIDPRPFQAIVSQRTADLNAAKSRIQLAKNTFERTQTLFNSGDVSAQIRDQRQSEYDEAKASVAQAQAALSAAELDLSYTTIRAPISGRISRQMVSVGNLINAGQDVLTTILSVDPIHFYFDINEQTYLNHLRKGENEAANFNARIALSDEESYPHQAKLDFLDNSLSNQTGTIRGRALVNNTSNLITPGMFGRILISGSNAHEAILIPDTVISTDQSRKLVMTLTPDNVVVPRPVTLGQLHNGLRVVLSGLNGDETIIVNGLQRAQPGATVAPEMVDLTLEFPETELEPINPTQKHEAELEEASDLQDHSEN